LTILVIIDTEYVNEIDGGLITGSKLSPTLDKIFAVGNIVENPSFFDSSHNHMVQGLRGIQSSATRGILSLRLLCFPCSYNTSQSTPSPKFRYFLDKGQS